MTTELCHHAPIRAIVIDILKLHSNGQQNSVKVVMEYCFVHTYWVRKVRKGYTHLSNVV